METTINIEEYLSKEERKEIARQVFTDEIRRMHRENGSEHEFMRIISNGAYSFVKEEINKQFNADIEKLLTKAIITILKDQNSIKFNLFYRGSSYESPSQGYKIMEACIKEHKDDIEKKVMAAINEFNYHSEVGYRVANKIEELSSEMYEFAAQMRDLLGMESKEKK